MLAACLHLSTNRGVFLTSGCFCSLCRCWRVREEHYCETDEVSRAPCLAGWLAGSSLFCFAAVPVKHEQLCQYCNQTLSLSTSRPGQYILKLGSWYSLCIFLPESTPSCYNLYRTYYFLYLQSEACFFLSCYIRMG